MSTAAPALTTWTLDASHTDAGFAVKHLMISTVRGRFAGVSGTVEFDPSDLSTGQARISIDTASIDTRDEKRDAHLKSADFFDVASFPVITFVSRRAQAVKGERFQLVGDLTIKDVTREVVLDVESNGLQADPWGGQRAGFSARVAINRKDFGLGWNVALEAGGVLVGEEVKITLDVELIKQA
jgi:polyisoprenoid-binding protein YceI